MLVTLDCLACLLAQLGMGEAEKEQEVFQSCSLPLITAMLLMHGQLNAVILQPLYVQATRECLKVARLLSL